VMQPQPLGPQAPIPKGIRIAFVRLPQLFAPANRLDAGGGQRRVRVLAGRCHEEVVA
jgi:hypothetical protein